MNHYEELTAFLKVVYQNLGVLHHNVVGHGFFTIHPQLSRRAYRRYARRLN